MIGLDGYLLFSTSMFLVPGYSTLPFHLLRFQRQSVRWQLRITLNF